jgi:hypothetical protein
MSGIRLKTGGKKTVFDVRKIGLKTIFFGTDFYSIRIKSFAKSEIVYLSANNLYSEGD